MNYVIYVLLFLICIIVPLVFIFLNGDSSISRIELLRPKNTESNASTEFYNKMRASIKSNSGEDISERDINIIIESFADMVDTNNALAKKRMEK